MSSAFVTGGSGFIGGRLIERLVADGHTVRALAARTAPPRRSASVAPRPSPAISQTSPRCAPADGCELAFHAAAALGDWGRREDFERGNVQGTRNVLEACASAGVKRFVHVGTEAALMAANR